MANINIVDSTFETGVIFTSEDGDRLEAVVAHLPSGDTFNLAQVTFNEGSDPTITNLFSCPVQAE